MAAFLAPLMATQATGHAGGHLHHGEQRVHAAEVGGLHGHADDGQRREGRHNTAEVGGLTGGGDDDLEPALGRGAGPLVDLVGVAVGAGDDQLVRNAEPSSCAVHASIVGMSDFEPMMIPTSGWSAMMLLSAVILLPSQYTRPEDTVGECKGAVRGVFPEFWTKVTG